MDNPTAYIESSVVSYYTARPSRDVIVLSHQEITRLWWDNHLERCAPCVSQVVLEEIGRGDPQAAAGRLAAVSGFPLLPVTQDVERLAALYEHELSFPGKALRDILHLALASVHAVDFGVLELQAYRQRAHPSSFGGLE